MTLAASTVELGLRMLVSLAFVAVLGWGVTRAARTRLPGAGGRRADLRICARQQLTRSASVAVLQAGDRAFLVGATESGVTLLAEGDGLLAERSDGPTAGAGAEPGADIVDVRAGDQAMAADGITKRGAGRRHGGADGLVPAGMGVIEALRERTVRRR